MFNVFNLLYLFMRSVNFDFEITFYLTKQKKIGWSQGFNSVICV